MSKLFGRLLIIPLLGVLALGLCQSLSAAEVTITSTPKNATANSLWNFTAVWTDSEGKWPLAMERPSLGGAPDGSVLDHDPTIGQVRPTLPEDAVPTATQWYPQLHSPAGFVGFKHDGSSDPQEWYQPNGFVSLQPDPAPTITGESSQEDPRYNRGMDFTADERDVDDGFPGIVITDAGDGSTVTLLGDGSGMLQQAWLRQKGQADDPETPEDESAEGWDYSIIVPRYSPLWLVGVWRDQAHQHPVRAYIQRAKELNQEWPDVNVIVVPGASIPAANRLYVSYYHAGSTYVLTQQYPLPMPYTAYRVPLTRPTDTHLSISDDILRFDPALSDLPEGGLLGVYLRPELDNAPDAVNYFDSYEPPGETHPHYGRILLTNTPPGGFPEGTELWVKVSSRAVDAIWTSLEEDPDPSVVRRLNYFEQGQWMPGTPDSFGMLVTPENPEGINRVLGVYTSQDATGTNYYNPSIGGIDFVPGDPEITLAQALPPGTTEVFIYYQSGDGPTGVYYSKQGLLKCTVPLPAPTVNPDTGVLEGQKVFVDYRPLSRSTVTVPEPIIGGVQSITLLPTPAEPFEPDPDSTEIVEPAKFRITDPEQFMPTGTYGVGLVYGRIDPDAPAQGVVWLTGVGATIPMYYHSGSPEDGAVYKVSVSAGINMSNPKQQPSPVWGENVPEVNPLLMYDPWGHPVWYAPGMVAMGDGSPRTWPNIGPSAYGQFFNDEGKIERAAAEPMQDIVVRDSRRRLQLPDGSWEMMDYGGMAGDRDWLSCYPDGNWPVGYDVDPLTIEPITDANPTSPDSGSSSVQYVFRVRYHNEDDHPPMPWLGIPGETGVTLFLDEAGTGDFTPYPMDLENPWAAPGDNDYNVYIFRYIPRHALGVRGNPRRYPWTFSGNYQSLLQIDDATETYHYFFACSDDSQTFEDGSGVYTNFNPNLAQWGFGVDSPIQDPRFPRKVVGYDEIDRSAHRRASADNFRAFDPTIFIDRPVRVPGLFEQGLDFSYKYKATEHPEVTCELLMPFFDDKGVAYDDEIYGFGRFLGTIEPFYRASNPAHIGSHNKSNLALLAETCGATTKTDVVFRILYKSKYNEPPIYIRLFVNNASEKTGTTPDHQYKAYTMYPRADQIFHPTEKYRRGVWYEYKTKLPPGPHTYYFEAYDGHHVVRYPMRPDRYRYADYRYDDPTKMASRVVTSEGEFLDWWLPTESQATERQNEDYVDNDYFPGPYINNPCVLSEATVTPGTGKEGTNFRYRVKYSDPDGQRVYSAYITIEVNDRGDTRTFQMKPETPIVPPVEGDPEYQQKWDAIKQQYKDGVYYVFDTATVNDFALKNGVRRYFFEFTDDWGRQHDVNDTIQGETTRYPAGGGNWISGPVISANQRPTLSKGSVESQDGTANAATLWTYRVTYRDINNDPPAFMKVYIGLLQPDGKTIMWDDGHTMAQTDPADNVYVDGAEFFFQTRLGAVDAVIPGEPEPAPKQYYYAFEAYDGLDWAVYNSSSHDEVRSEAAGCVLLQPAERIDETNYKFNLILSKQLDVANPTTLAVPESKGVDIIRVLGVYETADLTGTNYYDPGSEPPLYEGGPITLTTAFPAGKTKAWLKYEAHAPIVGPLPIDLPAPAGVIPDAQIFEDYSSNPIPLLIDDQKNGWISSTDPTDRGTMTMQGLAVFEGQPSNAYVVPENPRAIASVEGVYLHPDFSGVNYYDPEMLIRPVTITGTVNPADSSRRTIIPDNLPLIRTVRGVYVNEDLSGGNYYGGVPGTQYQDASVIGSGTVWPSDPNAVVNILGIFTGMDDTLPTYFNQSGIGSQEVDILQPDRVRIGDRAPVQEILGIYTGIQYDAAGVPLAVGDNYYTGGGEPAPNGVVVLTTPLPDATANAYVLYRTRGMWFGPVSEYIALTRPVDPWVTKKLYLAYRAAGDPRQTRGLIELDQPIPDGVDQVYIEINPVDYAAGDKVIPLTTLLPDTLHPADPNNRTVYIKYHDMRFTHQLRGLAQQPFPTLLGITWATGTTHYTPDGYLTGNVHIKSNSDDNGDLDPTGGVVGIWLNSERDKVNYFRPYYSSPYDPNPEHLRLTQPVPSGTTYLWARYYQSGDYRIDRWNRNLVFLEPRDEQANIQGSFFFGTPMPRKIGANTACELYDGKLTPLYGSQSTQYVYSVTYRDLDGENGQAPAYVRVYIDGNPYEMTPVNTGGTPAYREGAVYQYVPPAGLPGGAHKFHFEASDGVSIAWFDANGSHQSLKGAQVQDVKDIDGPWINNPPDLTAGQASPNPTTGTIGTDTSVDYTVTFTDIDNNPPYFYDPVTDVDDAGLPLGDALKVSGSPRVWIDSGSTDVSYSGTVQSLTADPLEPSKTRTIVATGTPGWSPDQFAGKFLQIVDGSLEGRVYLVQSNTSSSLILATDDLVKDGITPGTAFRINGLLMRKADPTQQNFTQGVVYKITVPKLPAGNHKFHFTARSRELKPQWLQEILRGTGVTPLPYSNEVRLPLAGDFSGPNVARTVPPGNKEPIIENNESTALWRGPMVQTASVDTESVVKPVDFLRIRSAQGVYLNANLAGTNYYDPNTTATPFKPGDTDIKLSPVLPAISADTTLVRLAQPAASATLGTNLQVVVPDDPASIGSVLGVYLESDTQLAGTNYYNPATANPAFATGDTQIRLTTALPSGTNKVYVAYKPALKVQNGGVSSQTTVVPTDLTKVAGVAGVYLASDTNMTGVNYYDPATANPAFKPGDGNITLTTPLPPDATAVKIKYVAWPPAYVKYFGFASNDGVYLAGEPLTFRINYKDPDNDPPTYHDSVQGYVRVVFNDSGRSAQMMPVNPPVSDYTQFVPFSVTLTDVPEGTHKFHFEGSDGYYDVTYPVGTSTNPRSNDYTIKVNYKPVLRSGTVDHTSGATTFTFTANYQDRDNVAPQIVTVTLRKVDDPSVVVTKEMKRDPAETSPNYTAGVRYTVQINAKDEQQPLEPGRYNVVFEANDGYQDADPLAGPDIVVRDTNERPVIVNYTISPAAGKMNETFTYSAFYYDAEGDSPVAIYNGQRLEGLTLIIDKNLATEQRLLMTRVAGGTTPLPGPPAPPDYSVDGGVEFRAAISGKKLGPGKHTYTVEAHDGTERSVFATGVPEIKSGPVLKVPYFDLQVIGRDGISVADRAVVGTEVLITGQMLFPYTPGETPRALNDVTIQVTKPDGNMIALNASITNIRADALNPHQNWVGDIVANYGGFVDPALTTGDSLTLTASGQWTIGAIWPGDAEWDKAETDNNKDGQNDVAQITVSGPARTVAVAVPENPETSEPVADMITPPMIIGSPYPDGIFGADRAHEMRIVRWSPTAGTYFYYGVGGPFPELKPGDAVWIKPKQYDPITNTGYPAAEPLGMKAVLHTYVDAQDIVRITPNAAGKTDYVAYVSGVYLNSNLTGTNYYDPTTAVTPFRQGDASFKLTRSLTQGTEVWVDYVVYPLKGVDEGWITLDNPTVARSIDGGEPRYYHSKYRLIKSLSQAYPPKTDSLGNPVLDPVTKLPLLKPCYISLKTGWNQFGNIFFNWKMASQQALPVKSSSGTFEVNKVQPVDPSALQGKLVGVYLTPDMTGDNYYQPGIAAQPYRPGAAYITLTRNLDASKITDATRFYLKYEQYPREDIGLPISGLHVIYLGQRKTLAEAAAAGWIHNYAWRYDAAQRTYVQVHATAAGAERVLKAWSGYWIRAFVDCTLEIDPNTSYSGPVTGLSAGLAREDALSQSQKLDMPPPIPD